MIAICDYDFLQVKRGLPPPSLAAMKMSSYLKQTQQEQIILLRSLDSIANYEKVYFFSDLIIDKLPKEIFQYDNVETYGLHIESVPSIVEHMIPDITIYNDIVQEKVNEKSTSPTRAVQFLDSIYYQAYDSEGKRIPLPPSQRRKRFYIYDKDFLSLTDAWDIIEEINERFPSGIYMTQPVQCHTISQFLKLREDYEKVARSNKVMLDYFVPLHHFDAYFSKYKLKLLGEITKTSTVGIYLGKNYGNNTYGEVFYQRNLFYCMNLAFSYYSRNIPIKAELYHAVDAINPYEDVYNALRLWINSEDYDLKLDQSFGSKKLQARKEELIKLNPSFEIFFSKTKNDLINTRGIWRIP